MKEGLNIAYLNGAQGYKKIVLGSQNEGGNEGGNTGGGEVASTIEYLDVSGLSDSSLEFFVLFSPLCKVITDDGIIAVGTTFDGIGTMIGYTTTNNNIVKAVGVDLTQRCYFKKGDELIIMSLTELLTTMVGVSQAEIDSIPRITKEEFYAI